MVNSDNIYKYIGLVVIIVFVIIIINRCLRIQFKIVESYVNNSKDDENENENNNSETVSGLAQQVLDKAQELEDKLLLEKYKNDYEDLIINTESMVSMAQVGLLKDLAKADRAHVRDHTMLRIVGMDFLKTSLNNIMKTLDKKPSSGGGEGGYFY